MTEKEGGGMLLITETDLIRRCVAELNGLSCDPYRPPDERELREDAILLLNGKDGNLVAGFAFIRAVYIRVRMGPSKPYLVRHERVATIGKLFSCSQYASARATVLGVNDRYWSDDLKMQYAKSALGQIRRIRKDLNPPELLSLQQIPELEKSLPEPQLDRLEEYPDLWD